MDNIKFMFFSIFSYIFGNSVRAHDGKTETEQSTMNYLMAPDTDYNNLIKYFVVPTSDIVFMSSDFKRTYLSRRVYPPLKGQYWGLGSRLLKHETPYMAIYRTLKDEGGLIIEGQTNLPKYVDTFSCNFDNVRGNSSSCLIHFFYLVVDDDLSLSYDDQHTEGQWFDCDDHHVHPVLKEVIRRAKNINEEVKHGATRLEALLDSTTFFVEHNSDWFATIDYIGEVESRGKFNPRILPPTDRLKVIDTNIKEKGSKPCKKVSNRVKPIINF